MKHSHTLKAILFALFLFLGFLAYREFLQINILTYVDQQNIWDSRRFIAFLVFCALSLTILALAVRASWKGVTFLPGLEKARSLPVGIKPLIASLLVVLPALFKWFAPLPETVDISRWTSFFLMYCVALVSAWLNGNETEEPREKLLKVSSYWLGAGAAYAACAKLIYVTGYPFPLYWSEGNRFFDYSTLFGSYRYLVPDGKDIYSFISWGMQLPWALPFILPNLGIGAFRFWNQLMWILPAFLLGLTAYKTFNREKKNGMGAIIVGLWAFVFLDQGPIYAPLLIAGVLTLFGLRFNLVPAALAITLASFYAHESRWTWSFAPGLWAGLSALLIMDKPYFTKERLKELIRPVLLGLAGLFGGRILPEIIPLLTSWFKSLASIFRSSTTAAEAPSLNIDLVPDITASATRQPLLWERLYPNSTYPPGILLGIIWAALPIIILLFVLAIKKIWKPNWFQAASVFIISAAFLGVGLTASVKIGGGSNLHNLDMFLSTLFITAVAALANFSPRKKDTSSKGFWISVLVAVVMVFPVTYSLRPSEKPLLPDESAIDESLDVIRKEIMNTSPDEEILFIDHRQLLTFNFVPQVQLVDDYEKKKLMDKALSDDAKYFKPFNKDIHDQRFALIISEPLNLIIRGEDYAFGDENDAYVKWVTLPLTCSYEPIYTNYQTGVQLLVPREGPPPSHIPCDEYIK